MRLALLSFILVAMYTPLTFAEPSVSHAAWYTIDDCCGTQCRAFTSDEYQLDREGYIVHYDTQTFRFPLSAMRRHGPTLADTGDPLFCVGVGERGELVPYYGYYPNLVS